MENDTNQSTSDVKTKKSHTKTIAVYIFSIIIVATSVYLLLNQKYNSFINKMQIEYSERISQLELMLDKGDSKICPECPTTNETRYTLLSQCNDQQCLFQGPEAVEGYSKLSGFYTTYNKEGWSGNQVTCDAFKVVNGTGPVFDHFMSLIERGNSLNALDSNGNLMIRINLKDLDNNELELLKNSSTEDNVTMSFIRHTPQGRSAGDCESVITILDIE